MTEAQKKAEKAAAKAKALRAEADAKKAAAEFEQEYGAGPDSDATAKAWDTYQEATNAAARAEKEAEDAQKAAAREKTDQALRAAAKVKVRDYILIADIPECGLEIPEDVTFGTLIEKAMEADADKGLSLAQAAQEATEWLEDTVGGFDTEVREKVASATESLLDRCDNEEINPYAIL